MGQLIIAIIFLVILVAVISSLRSSRKKKKLLNDNLNKTFPESWKATLNEKVVFYKGLSEEEKRLFEKRVQLFLATKSIEGIDTSIDDMIRVFVAASAIIPTFAFPDYNYPHVQTVLIYPNSFDEHFQTQRYEGHKEFITGMVGNRFMDGTVILSKPDLINDFSGQFNNSNVGIHEFVHLLDKEDGAVDGIPEALISQPFVGPWLHEIKAEIKRIEQGRSDINPYALKNNAEFLAVVSEYFFDNPARFQDRHPELYQLLSVIFSTKNHLE
ncbi:MAG TPA: M90 family metallopeptidase [Flavipsychrobacter sp.]|nr:M90 family metallopeptidase [Flavipsychrobacter sp.]